jgi:hypothetical protein
MMVTTERDQLKFRVNSTEIMSDDVKKLEYKIIWIYLIINK